MPFKVDVNLKALEPIGRELKTVGKVMSLSLRSHSISTTLKEILQAVFDHILYVCDQ